MLLMHAIKKYSQLVMISILVFKEETVKAKCEFLYNVFLKAISIAGGVNACLKQNV